MQGSLGKTPRVCNHFLVVKNTTVNIEVSLTSFKYQIKLKSKQILFSHYNMKKLLKQIANNTEPKRSFL